MSITLPPLPERPWRMFCTKCGRTTPLDAKDVQHSPPGSPFVSHFGVCPCGYQALAEQAPWTADQLRARDLEIVRLVLEDARPEPDCRTCAKRSALRERVKLLEDALRHVDDCLSINDYDDYVLLSRFDSDIVSAALEQKP